MVGVEVRVKKDVILYAGAPLNDNHYHSQLSPVTSTLESFPNGPWSADRPDMPSSIHCVLIERRMTFL